jgi:hypothetical protein
MYLLIKRKQILFLCQVIIDGDLWVKIFKELIFYSINFSKHHRFFVLTKKFNKKVFKILIKLFIKN